MKNLTLYELCGEDMEIFAKKRDDGLFEIEVFNENDERVFFEITHEYAWKSLVDFAKQVVFQNSRIQYLDGMKK
jgi:hypothetical protein